MSDDEVKFVLIHDVGMFGPFDSQEAARDFGRALCVDPNLTYGYEVWPMKPPRSPEDAPR